MFALVLASLLPMFISTAARISTPFEQPGKSTQVAAKNPSPTERLRMQYAYSRLPLYFVENRGQVGESVKYYQRGGSHTAYFTREGISFASGDKGVQATLTVAGMRNGVDIIASEPLQGRVNHFVGDDPGRWVQDVPTFGSLTYKDIYQGVDLRFYGNDSRMEYDIIVRPGADPRQVKLEYTGVEDISVTEKGDLLVKLAGRDTITQKKPAIYQEVNGERVPLEGSFEVLQHNSNRFTYGFRLASYDPGKTLVIDPAITYSSYLGGTDGELIYTMAADASGNVYVAGFTLSADYPTTPNAVSRSIAGDHDCFVTKIDPSGALAYSTYLGGSDYDTVFAMAVDASGNIYLGGATGSIDFPVTQNGTPKNNTAAWDGFIAKIDGSGALVYSTCLGGSGGDEVHAVAVDASGNAYVAGVTLSTDFPVKNPITGQESLHQGDCATYSDCMDGFVAKLDPSGALAYSTYFGGSGDDEISSIAVDTSGNIYVGGLTNSLDFPTMNPIAGQGSVHQGNCGSRACDDGFVAKINPSGALVYSTYLGGNGEDEVVSVAVDASGNVYAAGNTGSPDFPTTPGAFSANPGGNSVGFIARINASGSSLTYSTCLGGNGTGVSGMALDASGNVYVAGNTSPSDFPTTPDAIPPNPGSSWAGFITKMNSSGSALLYSTCLGWADNDNDMITAMAADASGNMYVAGYTYSSFFPITPNATYPTHGADQSGIIHQAGFITRLSPDADLSITMTAGPNPVLVGGTLSYGITVSNAGPGKASGVKVSDLLPAGLSLISAVSSQGACSQSSGTIVCNMGNLAMGASATVSIQATALQPGSITNTATVSADESDPAPNNNSATIGTTIGQSGYLTVTLSPQAAIAAGAKWQVDNGSWQASGTTLSNVGTGSHTVTFQNVAGLTSPANQTVTVSNGRTTSAAGTYVQQTGSLIVASSPQAAVDEGAQWQMDSGGWQASGSGISNVPIGPHTVSFKDVTGWTTPGNVGVMVANGQTATITGTYAQQAGSLVLTITPVAAVQAGAQWKLDSRAWQPSGAIITNLPPGSHTVSFNNVAGWTTPARQKVTISQGQGTASIGAYVQDTGTLTVTLSPKTAIAAGAQWQVDAGEWKNSGTRLSLVAGTHTVSFKGIEGWNGPASRQVNIINKRSTAIKAIYKISSQRSVRLR